MRLEEEAELGARGVRTERRLFGITRQLAPLGNAPTTRLRVELATAGAYSAGWLPGSEGRFIAWAPPDRVDATLRGVARALRGIRDVVLLHGDDPMAAVAAGQFTFTGEGGEALAELERDLGGWTAIAAALIDRPVFDRRSGLAEPAPKITPRAASADVDPLAPIAAPGLSGGGGEIPRTRGGAWKLGHRVSGRQLIETVLALAAPIGAEVWPIAVPAGVTARIALLVRAPTERAAFCFVRAFDERCDELPRCGALVTWGDEAPGSALERGRSTATERMEAALATPPALGDLDAQPALTLGPDVIFRAEMALAGVRAAGWIDEVEVLAAWRQPETESPEAVLALAERALRGDASMLLADADDPINGTLRRRNFHYAARARERLDALGTDQAVARALSRALQEEPDYRHGEGSRLPERRPRTARLDRLPETEVLEASVPMPAWTSALAMVVEAAQIARAQSEAAEGATDAGCARCGARYSLPDGTPLRTTRCGLCRSFGLVGVTTGPVRETEPAWCPH